MVVSLNSRLESKKEEEEKKVTPRVAVQGKRSFPNGDHYSGDMSKVRERGFGFQVSRFRFLVSGFADLGDDVVEGEDGHELVGPLLQRLRLLYCQPTGPNSLYHRDD